MKTLRASLLALLLACTPQHALTKTAAWNLTEFERHIQGAIIGAALGDALGRVTEFMPSLDEIHASFPPNGITGLEQLATFQQLVQDPTSRTLIAPYTDDTVMALETLYAALEGKQKNWNIERVIDRIARNYAKLFGANKEKIDRLYRLRAHGLTNIRAGEFLAEQIARKKARTKNWWNRLENYADIAKEGGCGSVMRSWPLGLIFHDNISLASTLADMQSCLTHRHPMARAASIAISVGIAHALHQETPDTIAQAMIDAATQFDRQEYTYKPDAKKLANQIHPTASHLMNNQLLTSDLLRYALEQAHAGTIPTIILGTVNDKQKNYRSPYGFLLGWAADEAIAAALYIFLRHPHDLMGGILEGVNTPGDSDSIAAIAGALIGAYSGLPNEINSNQLENKDMLFALAHEIALVL